MNRYKHFKESLNEVSTFTELRKKNIVIMLVYDYINEGKLDKYFSAKNLDLILDDMDEGLWDNLSTNRKSVDRVKKLITKYLKNKSDLDLIIDVIFGDKEL